MLATECESALVFIDISGVKAHRAAAGSKEGSWHRVLDAHAAVAAVRFTSPYTITACLCGSRLQAHKRMIERYLVHFSVGRNSQKLSSQTKPMVQKSSAKPFLSKAHWQ